MAQLIKLDERIGKYLFGIKLWLKHHGLLSYDGINDNVAMWLAFFSLQQLTTPILPPIDYFQDVLFDFKYEANNQETIAELLIDFFFFYEKFDFASEVICPAISNAVSQTSFSGLQRKNSNLIDSKKICIQDPFDRNCFLPFCSGFFSKFRNAIMQTAKKLHSNLNNGSNNKVFSILFNFPNNENPTDVKSMIRYIQYNLLLCLFQM